MTQAEQGLMKATSIEILSGKGHTKKLDRTGQYVFNRFYMLLDQEFHLEKYYGRRLSSRMQICVHQQTYWWQNEWFRKGSQFLYNESDLYKLNTWLGFGKGLILNLP